ncbi:MAG TPA: arginine--tRNA ligase [Syntrophomonadaceae bacterium]|nr:arginine--tRNA ligase [Syntrophomonadaceae bacterium]
MNLVLQMHENIRQIIIDALHSCQNSGVFSFEEIPLFVIEVPREKGHGDFACNIAMLMAKQARTSPRKIAESIVDVIDLEKNEYIDKIEVAGAGFINIYLNNNWLYKIPALVKELGDFYGSNISTGKKIQVEFVSANPTGNLHMGNARGGAIGDSLANILKFAGNEVEREFYINDAGNQIEVFAASLEARYLQLTGHDIPFPDNGYAGQDVVDTVKDIIREQKDGLLELSQEERRKYMVEYAIDEKIKYIKTTLGNFGITYDVWFSEKTLHQGNKIDVILEQLEEKGYIYEQEDARWFKASLFGDEKDEVVMRSNGLPTYFAVDIAYHQDKFKRGFDKVINIWGADHYGHVGRMKGAVEALGYNQDRLEILIMQLVRLYRGGNIVKMSKRTGTLVTLDELIDEVGKDAARFFFVMRNPDSHLDFDLELAKKQSQDNPVYYVQYAHARICSIFRQADMAGISMPDLANIDVALLKETEELDLLRKIADFPEEIMTAARFMAPHRIAHYVMDLAGLFHSFYNSNRVLNDDLELQNARLLLMDITRITIKNALTILGVSAPKHM